MAITHRKGDYNDYDPSRMRPAEFGITLMNDPKAVDGRAVHIAFAAGEDKTLMTFEDAEGMIEDAAEEATAAATSQAQQYATNSQNSATESRSYAKGGTSSRSGEDTDNAMYYKNQAANSATAASNSAAAASGSASTASTKASEAATSATNASGSATAASNSAGQAASSATAASGSATAASGSASAAQEMSYTAEAWAVGTKNGIDVGSSDPQYHNNSKYYMEQAEEVAASIPEDYSELSDDVDQLKNALIVNNASGAIASFPDGGDGFPVRGLTVQMEPIQAGSGDPSPDNVRPISGRDSVTVTRTGKNLWNWRDTGVICEASASGRTSINDTDKTVRWGSSWGKINLTAGMKWKENTQYTIIVKAYRSDISDISSNLFSLNSRVYYTDETYTEIKYVATAVAPAFGIGVITTSANKTVERIQLVNNGGITYVKYDESGIFEGVLTADDFAPYLGQKYPITFPSEAGTVYGGTLDVTTGVLTVDRVKVDIPSTGWQYANGAFYCDNVLPDGFAGLSDHSWLCSRYLVANAKSNTSSMGSGVDMRIANQTGSYTRRILVKDTNYTSAEDFMESLTGDFSLLYTLVTPITYNLTPTEVKTLLGANNIWADTGDSAVDYVADTKLYIEQLTEPDADMIADANITSGKYFMVGNSLYLATANIANGAAIVVGTNCTRTSLAEALNAINA